MYKTASGDILNLFLWTLSTMFTYLILSFACASARVGCCFCSVANGLKLMFGRPEGGNHTLWKHAEEVQSLQRHSPTRPDSVVSLHPTLLFIIIGLLQSSSVYHHSFVTVFFGASLLAYYGLQFIIGLLWPSSAHHHWLITILFSFLPCTSPQYVWSPLTLHSNQTVTIHIWHQYNCHSSFEHENGQNLPETLPSELIH